MKKYFRILAAASVTVALTACEIVDNQSIINQEQLPLANPPAPEKTDFVANNSKHKVIVAAIDTGVDYDHPSLKDNMHFDLNDKNEPVGLGFDFIGNDVWPSSYLARTSLYDKSFGPSDVLTAKAHQINMQKILAADPSLGSWIDPNRNNEQEYKSGSYHGTHVAGLMVYDNPAIGFRAYRVLPHNVMEGDMYGSSHDYVKDFSERLVKAIDKAAADGAQVVNISLGLGAKKPLAGEGKEAEAQFKKMQIVSETIKNTVSKYPNTLYVVAAGNDGTWTDGKNRLALPCSVGSPNLLCVGALTEDGEPAAFTNIYLGSADFIMTLGDDVLSTTPMKTCVQSEVLESVVMSQDAFADSDIPAYVKKLKEECKDLGMSKLSGTSMASPLIAHAAAEMAIAHPELKGRDLAQALLASAEQSNIGVLPVRKLKIKKPSWYGQPKDPSDIRSLIGRFSRIFKKSDEQYWEAVTPVRAK